MTAWDKEAWRWRGLALSEAVDCGGGTDDHTASVASNDTRTVARRAVGDTDGGATTTDTHNGGGTGSLSQLDALPQLSPCPP